MIFTVNPSGIVLHVLNVTYLTYLVAELNIITASLTDEMKRRSTKISVRLQYRDVSRGNAHLDENFVTRFCWSFCYRDYDCYILCTA